MGSVGVEYTQTLPLPNGVREVILEKKIFYVNKYIMFLFTVSAILKKTLSTLYKKQQHTQ